MAKIIFGVLASSWLLCFTAAVCAVAATKPKPDHVLFMVFDQMRPDYIDRYDLKNFKKLRAMGQNYPNAYVGHSAAVTVVSHAVMTTGLLPKDLPWSDDVLWDKEGVFGKKNANYNSTNLSIDQLLKALKGLKPDTFLVRMLKKLGGEIVALGEKNYSTIVMGGPYADRIITLQKKDGRCTPTGVNVPDYIAHDDRYNLECSKDYGTKNSFFALDGNRYYPGTDEKHLGGDVWTADAALSVMKHEKWSALFITFGAIDRIGHMMGDADRKQPHAFTTPIDLEQACRVADAQVGRLLDELAAEQLLNKTLIISTADHGGQSDLKYFGNGKGETVGRLENDKDEEPPAWSRHLAETGRVRLGAFDTGVRLWLKEPAADEAEVLKYAKEISCVTHIFALNPDKKSYREVFKDFSSTDKRFQGWANKHDQELADTMASSTGPDLILFFENSVGFALLGDHGGAQEMVQRIPMIIYDPAGPKGNSQQGLRLVDLKALILSRLKLAN